MVLGSPKGSQPTGRELLSLSLAKENEFMLAPALKTPELWAGMRMSDPLCTGINELLPPVEMLGHFSYGT